MPYGIKWRLKLAYVDLLCRMARILPIVPFSRIGKDTDAKDFVIPHKLRKNPFLGRTPIIFVIEVPTSLAIWSVENNPQNGWFGYVLRPGWSELRYMPSLRNKVEHILNLGGAIL